MTETTYEFIVCNNPGNKLQINKNNVKETEPDKQPSLLKILVCGNSVTCLCSGEIMKHTKKEFPAMESNYQCSKCNKDISIVWD